MTMPLFGEKKKKCLLPVLLAGLLAFPSLASAIAPSDKYPRLANNFMRAGIGISSSDVEPLSRYDLVVLPAEAQIFNPGLAAELRRLNPDIVLLAYVPTKSFALVWSENPNDTLHRKLLEGIRDEWRLRDGAGRQLSVWPRTWSLNMNSGWAEHLPRFVAEHVLSSGYWDGVFYDESSATISWLNGGDIDLDGDGRRDEAAMADRLWKQGMIRMLETTRRLVGPNPVIVINGDSDGDLAPYVNGRMFETFPTPWEHDGAWSTVTGNYLRLHGQVAAPPVFIVNSNTDNTGDRWDFRKMRFGLASTLLGDGYFGFSFGDQDHGQLWFYDEYEAYLGEPLGEAVNLTGPERPVRPGLWMREFRHGVVLVNSTNTPQTADLGGEFERLHGRQDPRTNNGAISNLIEVPAMDGLILLRPVEEVRGASYRNGSFTRVLNLRGEPARTGFFAMQAGALGGATVARADVAGAGTVISANGNRLEVRDAAGRIVRIAHPFGEGFAWDVEFSVGRAGGRTYVAASAGRGGPPLYRLYDASLEPLFDAREAYAPAFRGGVWAAVGDLDGDGSPDIVTGAGAGGGPHVRAFNAKGELMAQFFAYAQAFTGGVHVALGDLDGDGLDEIVTGAGFGGGPHVRVFDRFAQVKSQFFAFDASRRSGVRVAAADQNGDGRAEILAMANDVFTAFDPLSFF